jgi:hypothetical protein
VFLPHTYSVAVNIGFGFGNEIINVVVSLIKRKNISAFASANKLLELS